MQAGPIILAALSNFDGDLDQEAREDRNARLLEKYRPELFRNLQTRIAKGESEVALTVYATKFLATALEDAEFMAENLGRPTFQDRRFKFVADRQKGKSPHNRVPHF